MIAKVTKGRDFGGVVRYLYGRGRHEEHTDAHRLAGNVIGDDPKTLSESLRESAELNPRVRHPVWHCSLRAAPEDRFLSDAEWALASEMFLRRVGFLDERHPQRDTPWVAVRHGDHHVHLVVSRVRFDGTVARDSFDYRRSHQAARGVEADFGLVNAGEREGRGGRLAAVTIAERESAARRGVDPERAALRDTVREARDHSGLTRAGFEAALAERGVLYRANQSQTGRMHGYSFSRAGWIDAHGAQVWLAASKVGKELRWAQLGAEIDQAGPGRQSDEVGSLVADRQAARAAALAKTAYPKRVPVRDGSVTRHVPHGQRQSKVALRLREGQDREREDRGRGR